MKANNKPNASTQQNVVYAVPCKDCPGVYYGQTKRMLQDRVKEHMYAVKKGDSNNAIAYHKNERGHDPNFNDTKILFSEKNLSTRLKLESWAITKPNSHAINLNHLDPVMRSWHKISGGGSTSLPANHGALRCF